MELASPSDAVELRRPPDLSASSMDRNEEVGSARHLAVEIPRIQLRIPDISYTRRRSATVNSGGQKDAARGVYSSFARALSTPSRTNVGVVEGQR
jgi:hypothetical protein